MERLVSNILQAAARRHRSRVLGSLLTRAIKNLFAREPRHAARPHFARQG